MLSLEKRRNSTCHSLEVHSYESERARPFGDALAEAISRRDARLALLRSFELGVDLSHEALGSRARLLEHGS